MKFEENLYTLTVAVFLFTNFQNINFFLDKIVANAPLNKNIEKKDRAN
jgi:hypothetical protein